MTAIEAAKKRGLIHDTVVNKEMFYRITNTQMVIIHDNTGSVCAQTDLEETPRDDALQVLQTIFLEFKRCTAEGLAKDQKQLLVKIIT